MILSIWRYSHLSLAISSFCFLLILSFTGIILSFDPMVEEIETFHVPKVSNQSIDETLQVLRKNYKEIIEIEVTKNYLLKVSGIDNNNNSDVVYVNPITGKPVAKLSGQKNIFKWATSLHRSLFLKSTGRIIVGTTSFLLFLISISGVILIIKRQGSVFALLSKVVKDNFYEYYHVIFSRILLIPILIIAFSGVYLSLEKFSLLPKQQEKHQLDYDNISQDTEKQTINIFTQTPLKEVQKIDFPFSEDVEDYYVLRLNHKELYIHQYTGDILSTLNISSWKQFYSWNFILHTGKGNFLWSLVLLCSSLAILFFIYSGFNITWQRIQKKGKKIKNIYHHEEAEYIILVGSETGSTFSFATSLYNSLIKQNAKTFITSLNNYAGFKNIKHLIVISATYGDGEPPKNADKFFHKFKQNPITKNIPFSIVGLGSTEYVNYCKYAVDVENFLLQYKNLSAQKPVYKINKQSFYAFQQWAIQWGSTNDLKIDLEEIKPKLEKSKVVQKTLLDNNDTFMITLKPLHKHSYTSGDLIGIKPSKNENQRFYSVAIINKNILLSIKKHEFGLCSNHLFSLSKNDIIKANFIENTHFHLPKTVKNAILIANGTGIAPFLGMIDNNTHQCNINLFVGFKNPDASMLYQSILKKSIEKKQLNKIHFAFSRTEKEYVQDILLKHPETILKTLQNKGVIMICGSLNMRDGVFDALNNITQQHLQLPLDHFKELGLIKTDCY